jgi:uncharacterized protein YbaR (Trm112 family)
MPPEELLSILRCPIDGSRLVVADEALVARLNAAIRSGELRNRSGRRVEKTLDGGLLRTAGDLLYPIVDQIPALLRDEAIQIKDQ